MRVFEASAPGRAGIIGNPSDIYGGVVVSCSVAARAHCRLVVGGDERLPEDRRLWDAAIKRFPFMEPVAVEWQTDVPRSSGLSGSTALLAATLACVLAAHGEESRLEDKVAFAELLRDVERYDANVVCGFQDAYMIVHGGFQRMEFTGKRPDQRLGPVAVLEFLHAPTPFLLITTGVERLSGAVHGPMAERWLGGEKLVVDGIEECAELGRLGAEAIKRENWPHLAELMTQNHEVVSRLGGSGDEVDRLIAACVEEGALAAKLAGAGLGGTVIALTFEPEDLEARLRSRGFSRFIRPRPTEGLRLGPN